MELPRAELVGSASEPFWRINIHGANFRFVVRGTTLSLTFGGEVFGLSYPKLGGWKEIDPDRFTVTLAQRLTVYY
jgi:hypothetical protein